MGWKCSNCGTGIGSEFQVCWNCGTDIHGVEDETFSVDSDPTELLEDPETPRIQCQDCGYQGKVLFSTTQKSGLEWLIAGLLSMLVSQRSWIHFCHRLCPACSSSQDRHRNWSGEISAEDTAVWETAQSAEDKRTKVNRQLIYLVVGCVLVAGMLLWWALRV